MPRPRPAVALAVLLPLAAAAPAGAADPEAGSPAAALQGQPGAAEIEACVESNRPVDSSIQSIEMVTVDRVGHENRVRSKMYWVEEDGRSKVLMHFGEPPDLRGSALLMLEEQDRTDMFMYLPELRKTRRVTSHMMNGSMFGTDFSYEDFQRIQGLAQDLSSQRLDDAEVDGRPVWVLAQTPDPDAGSEYARVLVHVDQATCVPLQTDFVKGGDRVVKRASSPFASVSKEASGWVPRQVVMHDLVEETHTRMTVDELEIGADIPRAWFSQSRLDRIGR